MKIWFPMEGACPQEFSSKWLFILLMLTEVVKIKRQRMTLEHKMFYPTENVDITVLLIKAVKLKVTLMTGFRRQQNLDLTVG